MSASRMIRCINGHVYEAAENNACPICGWTELGKATAVTTVSTNGETFENGGGSNPPNPNRNLMMIGAAAFGVIALAVVSYTFLKSPPVPDPIVKVPDKVVEKTPDKVTERPTEKAAEVVPDKIPDKLRDKTAEKAPEIAPDKVPDNAPAKIVEKVPEKITDIVVEKKVEPQPVAKVVSPVVPNGNGQLKFDALETLNQDAQTAAAIKLGLSPFATEMALMTRAITLAERQPTQLQYQRLLVPFVKSNQPMALADAGSSSYFGYSVGVDDQVALDYFNRSADQGSVRARAMLAQMRLAGRGQPRDPKAAADFLVLAARADSPFFEQIMLGLKALNVSLEGKGSTSGDLQKAFSSSNWELSRKLAQELADVKIAKGYHVLGLLSWSGNAVQKDQAVAIEWFKKASAIGFSPATESLSLVAKSPPSGSGNLVEAMVLLEVAYLQSESKQRAIYFTDRISEQAGLLDHAQWAAIKTLFADIAIPGPS